MVHVENYPKLKGNQYWRGPLFRIHDVGRKSILKETPGAGMCWERFLVRDGKHNHV